MAVPNIALAASLAVAAGCDQLPWGKKSSDDATAAPTTAASPVSPGRPAVLPADVLATVNGAPISRMDVELRIQELKALAANLGQPWEPLPAEGLQEVLSELVNTELMSQDAIARGLNRSLDTERRWEYLRRGFFAQEWLRWHQERGQPAAAEVSAYYEQNQLGFRDPERRRLRQLVVSSEEQAKQALAQLHGGAVEFEDLARRTSLGPTASDGGLLKGSVMRANDKAFVFASDAEAEAAGVTSLDPALEAAAFAIDQANGLSSYVKASDGRYHIFQLVERTAPRQRPLSEVSDDIKNFLIVQKLQQAITDLEKQAAVERFTDRLGGIAQ